ncbi:MAG: hypothetical protein AAGI72_10390 [Pseudomonadota bacterium]
MDAVLSKHRRRKDGVVAILGFAALTVAARANTATLELAPKLRLELKSHTTWAVADLHESAGIMVSASRDKTIREWDIDSGELLHTYRVPTGQGEEGSSYAVSISPDGRLIAVGGQLGIAKPGQSSVFLIDREERQLTKSIDGLPDTVFDMDWSMDGRYLAVGTSSGGLRVFESPKFEEVFQDQHDRCVVSIDFEPSGRMLTSSVDGFLRLYDSSFDLLAKVDIRDGGIGRAAFSPDGALVANGSNTQARVEVRSGFDLSYAYSPDTSELTYPKGLSDVAWSRDGEHLLATGEYQAPRGTHRVYGWSRGGRGEISWNLRFPGTVKDMLPAADGRIFFSTADGDIVGLDQDRTNFVRKSPTATITDSYQKLRVSDDGSKIRFRFHRLDLPWWKSGYIAELDINNLQMSVNPPPLVDELYYDQLRAVAAEYKDRQDETQQRKAAYEEVIQAHQADYGKPQYPGHVPAPDPSGLFSPLRSSDAMQVARWRKKFGPTLNGAALKTGSDGLALSVAFKHDGSGLVLASEFGISYFTNEGKRRWRQPVVAKAIDVNVAPNGHVVVTLFDDGSLEWRRMTDGGLLLSLSLSYNAGAWVLWTPEGYYHAAGDAESVLGYQQNNGIRELASFYPVERFASVFNRPDLIKKRLTPDQSYYTDVHEASGYSESALQAAHTPSVSIRSRNADGVDLFEFLEEQMISGIKAAAQDPVLLEEWFGTSTMSEEDVTLAIDSYMKEIERAFSENSEQYVVSQQDTTHVFQTKDAVIELELLVDSVEPAHLEISRGYTTIKTLQVEAGQGVPVELALPLSEPIEEFQIRATNRRHGLKMPARTVVVTRGSSGQGRPALEKDLAVPVPSEGL